MKRLLAWKNSQPILLAGALALCVGVAGIAAIHGGVANAPVNMKLATPAPSNSTGYAPIVKKVFPTVVSIESTKTSKEPAQSMGDMQNDPLFRQFFGDWSFYMFSSGGGANQPRLGDFETKRFEQLRLFGHLLA